jgi:hypothetical protein
MVYRESIRKIALGTGIFGYNPLKSNEEMLIGVYGEQCLKAKFALMIAVSVSGHIVLIGEVWLGYFAKRLKYNSFRTLLIT